MNAGGMLRIDESWLIVPAEMIVFRYEIIRPDGNSEYCHGFVDIKETYKSRDIAEIKTSALCDVIAELCSLTEG